MKTSKKPTENLSECGNKSKPLLGVVLWDSDLENIGLPSNMHFGFGSEFGDIYYRLQKENDNIRWCVWSVDRYYYIIKQEKIENEWIEVWTKEMSQDFDEAKSYCEYDALEHYA